jgi:predicted ATPase
LRQGLHQLVEAEFLYQRGLPPQATYVFKHALIQDAAYQSLLWSTRQQHHQHIAQVVEQRFPELCAMQPELLAHHYTEAEVLAQAIPYWQRAGQRAIERSANVEAVAHLTKGLELLATLPDTFERVQQELVMQTTLGPALMTIKGFATPEVERVYTRARALCRQVGETPQLFPVLWGLWLFYEVGGEVQTARELAEQLLSLAQRQQDPALLLSAYRAMGQTVYWQGELVQARAYLEQGIALYDPQRHRSLVFHYSQDAGVGLRTFVAHVLWYLGYPEQAVARLQEALTLARELSHPFSLALALDHAAWLHQYRREERLAQEQAGADMALSREQGFAFFLAHGTIFRGWALAAQGQRTEGITQMHQGLDALRTRGVGVLLPRIHTLLAEAYGESGQAKEGLRLLAEALATADHQGMHLWEPELYRVKGELLLRQPVPDAPEAERCFRQALDSARRQEAKSLELRAATSLSRLWQRQGRRAEARQLLAPIYGWFTEGFETVDLKEAKALLEELSA